MMNRPQVSVRWMCNRLRHHLPVRRILFVVGLPLILSGMLAGCRAAVDTAPTFGTQTTSDQTYVIGIVITPVVLPEASSGNGSLSYKLTGDLPEGLSFDAGARTLTGTPTAVGTYAMTYRVEDADGDAATLRFRILVVPPDTAPSFGPHMIADQRYITGTAITALVLPEATGGNGALSYMLTGDVPDGLSFDVATHSLMGIPSKGTAASPISFPKTYEMSLQVTDADANDTVADADTLRITIELLRRIYWTNRGYNGLQRGNFDGSDSVDIYTGGFVTGVALDRTGGKVYWSTTDTIKRANRDGGDTEEIVVGLSESYDIVVDTTGGKIYWSDLGSAKIQRANLDGTGVEDLVTGLDAPFGVALAVTAGKIYWGSEGTGIQRANLDGTGVEDLVTELETPSDVALDLTRGKMYWTDSGTSKIQRANLDGTGIEDIVTTELSAPQYISVDAAEGRIYWGDYQEGGLRRANLDGSNVEDVITGFMNIQGFAIE